MPNTYRIMIVLILSSLTSGCFLPPAIALMAKPITFFIKYQFADDRAAQKGPISVDELLIQAGGKSTEKTATALSATPNTRSSNLGSGNQSISVDQLLARARVQNVLANEKRSAGDKMGQILGSKKLEKASPVEVALAPLLSDSAAFIHLQIKLNKRFARASKLQIVLGAGSSKQLFKQLKGIRELCTRLGGRCHMRNMKIAPQVPFGIIRFQEMKERNNA